MIDAAGTTPSPHPPLLAHYRDRLHDAFVDHLDACLRLYAAGLASPAWHHETEPMRQALDAARQSAPTTYRYGLAGTSLLELRS